MQNPIIKINWLINLTVLENREYCRKGPSRWPRGSFYPQKLALTSPTIGCCSVGIVRSQTQIILDVSTTKNQEYGSRDPSRWPRDTLYTQKLAITSPTSGGRSVGIVRSRTQTMEFVFFVSTTTVNMLSYGGVEV
jgi:hypothetical protein